MANYAVWNNRLRHEWLTTPLKGKYLSKRKRSRIGLQDALERRGEASGEESTGESSSAN